MRDTHAAPPRRITALLLLALAAACGSATEPEAGAPGPGAPPSPPAPPPPPPPPPAPGPLAYRFGAKFEPPIGRVVHGQGQWVNYNAKYTALLPSSAQPAAELIFVDLGDTPRPWEPEKLAERFAALDAVGRIPSIDISLRGLQPTPAELAQMPDKLFGIDDDVANTTQYDGRIQDLILVARNFRKPVIIRIGGEFSGWWNGYHPYEYPKAFRKIVMMFRQAGVDNVAFVWCYEPAAANDFDAVNTVGQPKWYPGADVVDWFAIDLFAVQDLSGPAAGHNGVLTQFGRTLRFLDMAVAEHKPVMIAESSPAFIDVGTATGAQAAWNTWFTPYFSLLASRPEILWFHYINFDWTVSSYYANNGWKNNDLAANSGLAAKYVAELGAAKYLHSGERALLKDYGKYQ